MNRSDLVRMVAESHAVPKQAADAAVRAIFGAISEGLSDGERIEIRGFGSFRTRRYEGYSGLNPRTGGAIDVGPKILPMFRPGKGLKQIVEA